MRFADQSGVLALIRLSLCLGESGYPHLLGIPPDLKNWYLPLLIKYFLAVFIFD